VYSRVVGYLRPVKQWNNGKQTEFGMRKTYNVDVGEEVLYPAETFSAEISEKKAV
jgi:hypothetical protein